MLTFCIPSKNNLRYLKPCIQSIKDNSYYKDNEILVYVDQDNDGTCDWLKDQRIRFIKNEYIDPLGIGHAYDEMFLEAKYDYVIAFHADMILGPNADKHLLDLKTNNNVVCATRIEPPLHPEGIEKIVKDFGMWPEDLKIEEFNQFVKENGSDKITKSIFAPWLIHRDQHLGHDPIFLSVFEDADLFRRMKLAGYDLIQSWKAMVYHLTCRGGQFAHAEKMEDFQNKSEDWNKNNAISMYEYIRKWGAFIQHSSTLDPIPNIKYNIGIEINNCKSEQILSVEPYFDHIKIDNIDIKSYCDYIQPYTSFDIASKFVNELTDDIILIVDYNDMIKPENMFQALIGNLQSLIHHDADDLGIYELGPFKLNIKKKEPQQPRLKLC